MLPLSMLPFLSSVSFPGLVSPPRNNYNHMSSPASTISDDEDSNHSAPNDLRAPQKSRHHGFGGYASFYSPPQSHGASTGGHSAHPQPQYVATNECRLIDYRGARIAAFLAANRQGEYLLCLPQAFELFLKHLVGGLHTVYTKLKRLDIVPIVCNVEQVRILRGLGAIQPGVNRCKLLSTHDFDVLYKDCTTARPGRPPKRSSGIPSPEPGNYSTTTPITNHQQGNNNLLPLLGFSNSKKARYSDDCEYANENLELKQLTNNGNVNLSASNNSAATAAAMLAANGYSAAFPFLQHLSAAANSMPNSQQQQQLVAAAAALGLPALPNRFGTNSPPPPPPPPPVPSQSHFVNSGSSGNSAAATPDNADFNPTAAYLWLLSQQQQHLPNAAAAAAALNLTREVSSRNAANSFLNGNSNANNANAGSPSSLLTNNNLTSNVHNNNEKESPAENDSKITNAVSTKEKSKNPPVAVTEEHKATNGIASNGTSQMNSSSSAPTRKRSSKNEVDDDVEDSSEDDDDDDDMVSNNSSNAENPVSSSGFNGIGNGNSRNHFMESMNSIRSSPVTPQSAASQNQAQPEHCLETLLRNIEGLLAIAAHNARQQQTQLQLQKAELRAELGTQVEREREMREHVEKQFHEEQKIRIIYQKRFKKERKLRRKLEHELHQNHHQLSSQSQQSAAAVSMNMSAPKSGLLGQSNGGGTNGPANTLSVLGSTKSPVSSLPPTPPNHTASSDEAE